MSCPSCGSFKRVKHGAKYNRNGKYQRYQCLHCGHVYNGERLLSLEEMMNESIGEATKRTDQK